jgi:hypothetical protein
MKYGQTRTYKNKVTGKVIKISKPKPKKPTKIA